MQTKNSPFSEVQKLETIKKSYLSIVDRNKKGKSVQASYRCKANKIYKEKLKKVFKPTQMQEYHEIRNFQTYFPSYLLESQKINTLNEDQESYINQTIEQNSKKDIYSNTMILDIDRLCPLYSSLPLKSKDRLTEKCSQKRVQDKKISLKKLNSRDLAGRSLVNSDILLSPILTETQSPNLFDSLRESKILSLNKSKISNRPTIGKAKNDVNSLAINENRLLDSLNQINSSKFSKKTFKISSSDFKKNFALLHGNQVFTNYYNLPQILNFQTVSGTLKKIIVSTKKQKIMLAFLTFDLNKDGFICENDLFEYSQKICSNHPFQSLIFQISQFCTKLQYTLPQQIGLPQQFLQNPSHKMYQEIFQKKQPIIKKKMPRIKKRNRYFTLQDSQIKSDIILNFKEKSLKKNVMRIDFEIFQQIFNNTANDFIEKTIKYFTQQQKKVKKQKVNFRRNYINSQNKAEKNYELMDHSLDEIDEKILGRSMKSLQLGQSKNKSKNILQPFDFRKFRSVTDVCSTNGIYLRLKIIGRSLKQI